MPLRVHLLRETDEELIENLRPQVTGDVILSYGDGIPDPPDYEILVCGVPDTESIEASPNLKHLIIPWSGLPRKTRELMRSHPEISVHNIHHNAVPVAEMAMALMLAAAKEIIPIDRSLRQHNWAKRYENPEISLLEGREALIIGYGAIGSRIALKCLAFDMRVAAIDVRDMGELDGDVRLYSPSSLRQLLPTADVLFLSLPLTPETEGMIGAEQLSLLPRGATLVNVSRGKMVDEEALYEELKSGRIRAGLDVWYNYPDTVESRANTPPSRFPFHELPNVVMTAHLAGHSDRTEFLRARELAKLLNLASRGAPLPNRVDLEKGY
jgi:phosphoglycerate dehydrogenase-like enzyme